MLSPPRLALPARHAPPRAAYRLAAAALALNLLISGNLLFALGVPYASEGGNPLVKMHPGTWLALAAFVAMLCETGDPAARLWRLAQQQRGAMLFLGSLALCLVWAAAMTGKSHLIVFIESFLPAGLLGLVVCQATPDQQRRLGLLLLALLLANILLALPEAAIGRHIVPIQLDRSAFVEPDAEFRPVALYDHPLTGGMLSMVATFLTLSLAAGRTRRLVLLALCLVGLLAFGGRTALAVTLAILVGWRVCTVVRKLLARQLSYFDVLGTLAVLTLAPIVVTALLLATPIGSRVAARFYLDDSARVRNLQWSILNRMDWHGLLFGITTDRQHAILYQLGLQFPISVIESLWLLLLTDLGALGFPLFVAGVLCLVVWCWRRAGLPGRLMLLGVLVVASTSSSLGRKSNVLTVLVPAVLVSAPHGLARERPARDAAAIAAPRLRQAVPA